MPWQKHVTVGWKQNRRGRPEKWPMMNPNGISWAGFEGDEDIRVPTVWKRAHLLWSAPVCTSRTLAERWRERGGGGSCASLLFMLLCACVGAASGSPPDMLPVDHGVFVRWMIQVERPHLQANWDRFRHPGPL